MNDEYNYDNFPSVLDVLTEVSANSSMYVVRHNSVTDTFTDRTIKCIYKNINIEGTGFFITSDSKIYNLTNGRSCNNRALIYSQYHDYKFDCKIPKTVLLRLEPISNGIFNRSFMKNLEMASEEYLTEQRIGTQSQTQSQSQLVDTRECIPAVERFIIDIIQYRTQLLFDGAFIHVSINRMYRVYLSKKYADSELNYGEFVTYLSKILDVGDCIIDGSKVCGIKYSESSIRTVICKYYKVSCIKELLQRYQI